MNQSKDSWFVYKFKQTKIPWIFVLIPYLNTLLFYDVCKAWSGLINAKHLKEIFKKYSLAPVIVMSFGYVIWIILGAVLSGKEFDFENISTFYLLIIIWATFWFYGFLIISITLIYLVKHLIIKNSIYASVDQSLINIKELNQYKQNLIYSLCKRSRYKLDTFLINNSYQKQRINNLDNKDSENVFVSAIFLDYMGLSNALLSFNNEIKFSSYIFIGFIKYLENLLDQKIINKYNRWLYFYWIVHYLVFSISIISLMIFGQLYLTVHWMELIDISINTFFIILMGLVVFNILMLMLAWVISLINYNNQINNLKKENTDLFKIIRNNNDAKLA
ncbi:hypothetical protein [Mycoplasma sp. E35C]|uniref:hypothetical protein n=1 Tax=Mycoplasma sp. E35C TaxID=2801918 RepID=UPI001CA3B05A|nr:hypothetical protein [Mycoplasma sp. E35C]QZX49134.1 hypothetical protein JJE79_03725 [Mycoplasma sp. E35C]